MGKPRFAVGERVTVSKLGGVVTVQEAQTNLLGKAAYWVVTSKGGRHFLPEEDLTPAPTYTLDDILNGKVR